MTFGSLLTTLAFIVGAFVFWWAAKRKRLDTQGMSTLALWGAAGGVLGAKLTEWVLMHPQVFGANPGAFFDPRLGGRTLIGGVLCGWLVVEIAKRRMGIVRSTGDLFALALPAGEAIGRIGCHFNGCCFGRESTLWCAVYQHGAWRYPTQLISAFAAAAIFGIVFSLRDKMPREGDLFRLYLLLYGVSRFVIEYFRAHESAPALFSTAQWACIAMAVYGVYTLRPTWSSIMEPRTMNS